MVRIAICDDVRYYTEVLSVMIHHWAQKNQLNLELEVFESGEEVIWAAEERGSFLAVFMDVELTGINGIETAAALRKADKYNSQIILIEGVERKDLGIAIMNRLLRTCEYDYLEI